MGLTHEHDLHKRRKGRNVGVALLLASLIVIVLGLTVVKVRTGGVEAMVTSEGN